MCRQVNNKRLLETVCTIPITAAVVILALFGCGQVNKTQVSVGSAASMFTDPRDGQTYRTVKIGELTWMAENLNYQEKNSWCYDNADSNCVKYGRLYMWYTAVKVCPAGWRLPDTTDWNYLIQVAGGDIAGTKLKSKTGWDESSKYYTSGTNDFGFSAMPSGGRFFGRFEFLGNSGNWWSATESNADAAWHLNMESSDMKVNLGDGSSHKVYGFSVRCVSGVRPSGDTSAPVSIPMPAPKPIIATSSFTDSRDGRTYRTVKTSELTWMAENLNHDVGNSWCYGNNESNCQKYGRLYDWNTALKACPAGWRLSTRNDWINLILITADDQARKLKSTNWQYGTDEFGFSALPGGHRFLDGSFRDIGYDGYWWGATEINADRAWKWSLRWAGGGSIFGNNVSKNYGFSVRCVRD
jgi:uncharacterized protein (TIGR02145 family)